MPHDLGDPLLSTTLLWWNAHTVPLSARWWNGPFFAPAPGVVAFSDHRLGESLIAAPLMWAGLSPVAAYNITLLLTFPLCALAAHTLAFVITRRHDAGIVAGLAYGFSPYRFAHLEHLELLAAYGMPAALAALHVGLGDSRWRWPLLFAAAVLVQAVSCSYYAAFFFVMLALWGAWFIRRHELTLAVRSAIALAGVIVILTPLAMTYRAIHQFYGFSRGLNDIVTLSADVTSYVTASPLVWMWGWTATLNGPERQLMAGAALVLLTLAGIAVAWRRRNASAFSGATIVFMSIAIICIAAAVFTTWLGPWQLGAGALAISAQTTFKPLSLALAALIGAVGCSPVVRDAFARRSPFAFYVIAAVALALCSLGPKPAFLGHQFLYEAPYAWLMRIALFGESIRVPARFAMPVILALSIAGAIAYVHLSEWAGVRRALLVAATVTIAIEAWSADIPMFAPPAPWPSALAASGATAVLDLPLGELNHDVAAMYKAARAGVASVNGYSGYQPPHYEALRFAVEERDETALQALAQSGPLLVTIDRTAPAAAQEAGWLQTVGRAARFDDPRAFWFLIDRVTLPQPCGRPWLPVASIRDRHGEVELPWLSGHSQRRGQSLTIDLGRLAVPCAVRISLGPHAALYPRHVSVQTSTDGSAWQTPLSEKAGGRAVLGALQRPRDPELAFSLPAEVARFVRIQLDSDRPDIPWAVTSLVVNGSPPE